jgi:hypothetical protein
MRPQKSQAACATTVEDPWAAPQVSSSDRAAKFYLRIWVALQTFKSSEITQQLPALTPNQKLFQRITS